MDWNNAKIPVWQATPSLRESQPPPTHLQHPVVIPQHPPYYYSNRFPNYNFTHYPYPPIPPQNNPHISHQNSIHYYNNRNRYQPMQHSNSARSSTPNNYTSSITQIPANEYRSTAKRNYNLTQGIYNESEKLSYDYELNDSPKTPPKRNVFKRQLLVYDETESDPKVSLTKSKNEINIEKSVTNENNTQPKIQPSNSLPLDTELKESSKTILSSANHSPNSSKMLSSIGDETVRTSTPMSTSMDTNISRSSSSIDSLNSLPPPNTQSSSTGETNAPRTAGIVNSLNTDITTEIKSVSNSPKIVESKPVVSETIPSFIEPITFKKLLEFGSLPSALVNFLPHELEHVVKTVIEMLDLSANDLTKKHIHLIGAIVRHFQDDKETALKIVEIVKSLIHLKVPVDAILQHVGVQYDDIDEKPNQETLNVEHVIDVSQQVEVDNHAMNLDDVTNVERVIEIENEIEMRPEAATMNTVMSEESDKVDEVSMNVNVANVISVVENEGNTVEINPNLYNMSAGNHDDMSPELVSDAVEEQDDGNILWDQSLEKSPLNVQKPIPIGLVKRHEKLTKKQKKQKKLEDKLAVTREAVLRSMSGNRETTKLQSLKPTSNVFGAPVSSKKMIIDWSDSSESDSETLISPAPKLKLQKLELEMAQLHQMIKEKEEKLALENVSNNESVTENNSHGSEDMDLESQEITHVSKDHNESHKRERLEYLRTEYEKMQSVTINHSNLCAHLEALSHRRRLRESRLKSLLEQVDTERSLIADLVDDYGRTEQDEIRIRQQAEFYRTEMDNMLIEINNLENKVGSSNSNSETILQDHQVKPLKNPILDSIINSNEIDYERDMFSENDCVDVNIEEVFEQEGNSTQNEINYLEVDKVDQNEELNCVSVGDGACDVVDEQSVVSNEALMTDEKEVNVSEDVGVHDVENNVNVNVEKDNQINDNVVPINNLSKSNDSKSKIDPLKRMCVYETMGGVCDDSTCTSQHFRDFS